MNKMLTYNIKMNFVFQIQEIIKHFVLLHLSPYLAHVTNQIIILKFS